MLRHFQETQWQLLNLNKTADIKQNSMLNFYNQTIIQINFIPYKKTFEILQAIAKSK